MIQWIISGMALLGTLLNANRNKYGFVLWLVTNIYWAVADFHAGLYAQSALFLAYTLLAVKGIVKWTQLEQNVSTVDICRRLKDKINRLVNK